MQAKLAQFMGTEECIIYSYDMATVPSVIPAFANAKDVIICDEVCFLTVRMLTSCGTQHVGKVACFTSVGNAQGSQEGALSTTSMTECPDHFKWFIALLAGCVLYFLAHVLVLGRNYNSPGGSWN